MKIEDNPAFAEKPFRICSVLCPENPLKVGETFQIKEYEGEYAITQFGGLTCTPQLSGTVMLAALCYALNNSDAIIRRPQFSDDEKALMRLLVSADFPWIIRADKWLCACQNEPSISAPGFKSNGESEPLPPELLSQIQNMTPFDAAAYLESEGEK